MVTVEVFYLMIECRVVYLVSREQMADGAVRVLQHGEDEVLSAHLLAVQHTSLDERQLYCAVALRCQKPRVGFGESYVMCIVGLRLQARQNIACEGIDIHALTHQGLHRTAVARLKYAEQEVLGAHKRIVHLVGYLSARVEQMFDVVIQFAIVHSA